MSYPPQGNKADVSTLESRLTAVRAGYLDELAAANLPTDVGNLLTRLSATRAGYLDALNRDRPSMLFPSAIPKAIVAVPAVAADLAFPDIIVAGLPTGISIARADLVLVIGALFDTSASENQIAAAAKTLRVKLSTGAWGTDDIVALTFVLNSLQVDADAYRGGTVLFGATDIKSVITGNATYNFTSEETNRSDAVIATGANLELLDVSAVVRVWFN